MCTVNHLASSLHLPSIDARKIAQLAKLDVVPFSRKMLLAFKSVTCRHGPPVQHGASCYQPGRKVHAERGSIGIFAASRAELYRTGWWPKGYWLRKGGKLIALLVEPGDVHKITTDPTGITCKQVLVLCEVPMLQARQDLTLKQLIQWAPKSIREQYSL